MTLAAEYRLCKLSGYALAMEKSVFVNSKRLRCAADELTGQPRRRQVITGGACSAEQPQHSLHRGVALHGGVVEHDELEVAAHHVAQRQQFCGTGGAVSIRR